MDICRVLYLLDVCWSRAPTEQTTLYDGSKQRKVTVLVSWNAKSSHRFYEVTMQRKLFALHSAINHDISLHQSCSIVSIQGAWLLTIETKDKVV